MVQTFLLFDTITNEKTVKFMQHDIIISTITWHLGLAGSNNFGEYTSSSPFTLLIVTLLEKKQAAVPFSMAIGNVELMHEYLVKHLSIRVRIEQDKRNSGRR